MQFIAIAIETEERERKREKERVIKDMAPSNPFSSGGEHRRRSHLTAHHGYPSNAIAAAEAAASYILSDGPILKRSSRNESYGASNAHHPNHATSTANANNSSSGNHGSFLLRMHRQREGLMQRQKRAKALSLKFTAWIMAFIFGSILLIAKDSLHQRQQRQIDNQNQFSAVPPPNQQPEQSAKNNAVPKVSVPLPPSIERRKANEKPDSSNLRGSHKKHIPENKVIDSKKEKQSKDDASQTKDISFNSQDNGSKNIITESKRQQHQHAIPPVLIFTYHTNLITTPESELKDEEDIALSKNVQSIISLHPGSTTRFLNDNDCLKSIRASLGPKTNLTTYFAKETHGMYKADICRGAALYETGGLYFDIDIEARDMSLWDVIAPKTEFVTTLVHKDSNHHGGFFQAFIGVTPQHSMMKRYLELFVQYYEGKIDVKGPLGVYFLRMAYDEFIGKKDKDEANVDLWQEVRYNPALFPDVKRKWGKRRACQMLVVAGAKKSDQFERKQLVPFFSHANGSRMCGGHDTNEKG